ncbi:MAG: hypothetical protein ACRD26_17945, partial [Vicinamibacterales bacterium]
PSPSPPPVPAPPAGHTHTLAGRITDADSGQPVSAARVQFMTGVNAGRLASTGVDGRYSLSELRAGSGLVRGYGPRHAAVEETISVPVDVAADFVLTATTPGSTAAPFTYRGTIWDSRGAPVGGAAVSMIRDAAANPLAVVTTGADGTFTITTQSTASIVRVTRDGHLPVENPAPPPLASTTVVNVTLPRITRYALQAIQPLRVGQSATLTAEVDTDDGLTSVGRAYISTTSSDEGVIAVTGLGAIVARAPGTATITAAYSGLTTTLSVQVLP